MNEQDYYDLQEYNEWLASQDYEYVNMLMNTEYEKSLNE